MDLIPKPGDDGTFRETPRVTISIVSHRQGSLVSRLLGDLRHCCPPGDIRVVLTSNVPEILGPGNFPFDVLHIVNPRPKGFGANHNAAFRQSASRYFCVMNPDIRISGNPYPALISALADPEIGVVAPLVVNAQGMTEDSARRFPTPARILRRMLPGGRKPDYTAGDSTLFPDWIAGMFMLFRADTFSHIRGFDESFFLYLEDVDLCARLRARGLKAALVPGIRVVHEARRDSHRRPHYLWWHTSGMMRFFARRWRGFYRSAR